ncbi:MAG TPA: hypothetical protein PLZ57_15445 [Pseudobdellovibrionaceae bacterium]|nr:hypothetical protein [Pseudobdellovibrionaceae bacterium]
MKLTSIQVTPRGTHGWTTGLLDISAPIVVIRAPNGRGKTPLLKSLCFGLGLQVELPIEIKEKCQSVEVTVSFSAGNFKITRPIEDDFTVSVLNLSTNEVVSFADEPSYSNWFAQQLGFSSVDFTSVGRSRVATLYSTILIPMFWVDQDRGWNRTYFSEKSFIWDQEEELTRLFLGLPLRRPFSLRENFEAAKADLAALESRLEMTNRAAAQEMRDLGDLANTSIEIISKEITSLESRLEVADKDLTSSKRIEAAYEERLLELRRNLSALAEERKDLESKRDRFGSVENELMAEVELLGTNVSSARAFRSFCGGERCKLFSQSEASYGKRLLYLADQLKDIKSEVTGLSARIRTLNYHETDLTKQIQELEKNSNAATDQAGLQASLTLYKSLINRLSELERTKNRIQKYEDLKSEAERLLFERERQKTLVDNLSPSRRSQSLGIARSSLREKLTKWLDILGTRALPQPIAVDESLKLQFGDQDLRGFSGSTLVRILLAYRTALFEASREMSGYHPGLLIMDAPRQHEINVEDFANFFESIHRTLSVPPLDLQIIISITDEVFPESVPHSTLVPTRNDGEDLKFFGPP